MRVVEVGFKIPDNTAYTALVALRRLGVAVARVERSLVYFFDEESDGDGLIARVETDETIFNPNTHRLNLRDAGPSPGEVWIEPLPLEPGARRSRAMHAVAWRLFDNAGKPATHAVVQAAAERLLSNPAIDRVTLSQDAAPP